MSGLNFLERTIAQVAPGIALNRALAREQLKLFGYDGANPGTRRGSSGGMHKNGSSESWRMQRDRVKLMWDARDMERNFGFVNGVLDRTVMYACARIQYKARTGDRGVNKLYEDYFHDWCGRSDLSGRFRLREQAELGLRSTLRDGDFGFVKHWIGRELRLQGIEADRLGDPMRQAGTDKKEVSGIIIGERGEPQFYRIYKRSRTNQYAHEQDVPAKQFLHLYRFSRMDQYRGITWLATALPHARDLYELFGFERTAAKVAASHTAFVRAKAGSALAQWESDSKNPGDPATMAMQNGKIVRIGDSEGIDFAPGIQRPSGAFQILLEAMVREMGNGLDMPFGFIYDMSRFGGVTARLETMQAQRKFERFQILLVDKMLEEVKNDVLSAGISYRDIPPHPNWKVGAWGFGAALTGDIGHDTTAKISKLGQGLTTASKLLAEDGENFEEVTEEQAREVQFMQEVAGQYKIPIELLHQRMPNATQLLSAMNTPVPPPQPQPAGLVDQLGDKGVKPLLDLLTKVGEGLIDRDTAVNNISVMYDLPFHQANLMVPDGPGMITATSQRNGRH